MSEESEQGQTSGPCIHSHEDMYLAWRHQGDGYNYFHCQFCEWAKPDLDAPVIKAYLQRKLAEEKQKVEAYRWVAIMHYAKQLTIKMDGNTEEAEFIDAEAQKIIEGKK